MKTRKLFLTGLIALLFAGSATADSKAPSKSEIAIETIDMMVDEINGSIAQKNYRKDHMNVKAVHQGKHVIIYVSLTDKDIDFDKLSKAEKDAVTKDAEQAFLNEIMSEDGSAQLRSLHRHYGISLSTVIRDAYGHSITHHLS